MKTLRNIEVKHIECQARVGGGISKCIGECIYLALKTGIDVLLFHNDNKYEINLGEIQFGREILKRRRNETQRSHRTT